MYEQELFAQRTPYLQWLNAQQQEEWTIDRPDAGKQICTLPFSSCMDSVSGYGAFNAEKIYLFARTGGSLTPNAPAVIAEAFHKNAGTVLVYADEDYRGSLRALYGIDSASEAAAACYEDRTNGTYRGAPWFKPDFHWIHCAPFLSGQCLCSAGRCAFANDKRTWRRHQHL